MFKEDARYDRRAVLKGTFAAAGTAAVAGALPGVAAASDPADRHGPPAPWEGPSLRGRGITYDTGFFQTGIVRSTHEPWDPKVVKREMEIIHDELRCTAVRVTGSDQQRLQTAATYAAHAGLEVWFSPFTCDLDAAAMLAFLAEAADFCERLRRRNNRVVLTLGSEISFTMQGFIPGERFIDRVNAFTPTNPLFFPTLRAMPAKINAFFAQAVPLVRERFGGQIGYPSLPFEGVDWTPFDFVCADFYPNMVDGRFPASTGQALAALAAFGKPVAITEFGCASYDGAALRAGSSGDVVEFDPVENIGLRLTTEVVRDEAEQADYLTGALDVFDAAGVDTAFAQTFTARYLPTRANPIEDVDRAAMGIVKVLEHGYGETFHKVPWEPKAGFWALADYYARFPTRPGRSGGR